MVNPAARKWTETPVALVVAVLVFCYGLVNVGLYLKFTPVYVATVCGDQTAELRHLELGSPIRVDIEISITCNNPNAYAVTVGASKPGRVWIMDRKLDSIGNLTLIQGSRLPDKGSGLVHVQLDASLTPSRSADIVHRLLAEAEVPVFVELQFDVEVGMNLLVRTVSLTAPFSKKCGMYLTGALWADVKNRLGPMICRDTFEEVVADIPHVGEGTTTEMSFSAAQMDPGRVAMGENLKNVSIIGTMIVCFTSSLYLVRTWLQARWEDRGAQGYNNMGQGFHHRLFGLHGGGADAGADAEAARNGWPRKEDAGGVFGSVLRFVSCGSMCNRGSAPRGVVVATSPAPRAFWTRQLS